MVYLGGIRNEPRPVSKLVDTDLDKDPTEIGFKNEEGVVFTHLILRMKMEFTNPWIHTLMKTNQVLS